MKQEPDYIHQFQENLGVLNHALSCDNIKIEFKVLFSNGKSKHRNIVQKNQDKIAILMSKDIRQVLLTIYEKNKDITDIYLLRVYVDHFKKLSGEEVVDNVTANGRIQLEKGVNYRDFQEFEAKYGKLL